MLRKLQHIRHIRLIHRQTACTIQETTGISGISGVSRRKFTALLGVGLLALAAEAVDKTEVARKAGALLFGEGVGEQKAYASPEYSGPDEALTTFIDLPTDVRLQQITGS